MTDDVDPDDDDIGFALFTASGVLISLWFLGSVFVGVTVGTGVFVSVFSDVIGSVVCFFFAITDEAELADDDIGFGLFIAAVVCVCSPLCGSLVVEFVTGPV